MFLFLLQPLGNQGRYGDRGMMMMMMMMMMKTGWEDKYTRSHPGREKTKTCGGIAFPYTARMC